MRAFITCKRILNLALCAVAIAASVMACAQASVLWKGTYGDASGQPLVRSSYGMANGPDDKVYVQLGILDAEGGFQTSVARFTAGGSSGQPQFDTSWGSGGILTTKFDENSEEKPTCMAVNSSGVAVVVAFVSDYNDGRYKHVAYAFSANGVAGPEVLHEYPVDLTPEVDHYAAITVLSDGSFGIAAPIYVYDVPSESNRLKLKAWKVTSGLSKLAYGEVFIDGDPDLPPYEIRTAFIGADSNDRLYATVDLAFNPNTNEADFMVTRFMSLAMPSTIWLGGGGEDAANCLAVAPSGFCYVAGSNGHIGRFHFSGGISFLTQWTPEGGTAGGRCIGVDGPGSVYVGGTATPENEGPIGFVIKMGANLALDSSWADDGVLLLDIPWAPTAIGALSIYGDTLVVMDYAFRMIGIDEDGEVQYNLDTPYPDVWTTDVPFLVHDSEGRPTGAGYLGHSPNGDKAFIVRVER